jgi:hypothetical protein
MVDVTAICHHSEFLSHLLLQLLVPKTELFSWGIFKFLGSRANKKASYIHNRTSKTALAPLVFVLVCVCNRLYLYQSDQPIQLALP